MKISDQKISRFCNIDVSQRSEETEIKENEGTYSYDEAFELIGHGCYNRLVLVACSLLNLGSGMDMFCFGIVLAMSGCDLEIGPAETGLLMSAPFVGCFFAFSWGHLADVKGRRSTLIIASSIGFTLSALGSFASSWECLLVFKTLGSFFSAAVYSLTVTYLGENVDNLHRARYLSIMTAINLGSELFGFIGAYLLQIKDFSFPIYWLAIRFRPWRLFSLLMALTPFIGTSFIYFLHETPKFLANKGDVHKALSIMEKIYVKNGGIREKYVVKSLQMVEVPTTSLCQSMMSHCVAIFRPPFLWKTLQLSFLISICSFTNNTFVMWFSNLVNSYFISYSENQIIAISFCDRIVSSVVKSDNMTSCSDAISMNTIYMGIGYGVYMTSVGLLASALAAWRRYTLISMLLGCAISLLLVTSFVQPVVNMLAFVLFQATGAGIGTIQTYYVDLYPTSHRGLASAFGMMVCRIMTMIGVNLMSRVIIYHCSATFYYLSLLLFGATVAAFFLPTDKKNKTSH